MKTFNYLLLILGLAASSLYGAASSSGPSTQATKKIEHYQKLAQDKDNSYLKLAIIERFIAEKNIVQLSSLREKASSAEEITEIDTQLKNLEMRITKALEIIEHYATYPFADRVSKTTRLIILSTQDQAKPEQALLKHHAATEERIDKIALEMAELTRSTGLGMIPRLKFERRWRIYLGKAPRASSKRKPVSINNCHKNYEANYLAYVLLKVFVLELDHEIIRQDIMDDAAEQQLKAISKEIKRLEHYAEKTEGYSFHKEIERYVDDIIEKKYGHLEGQELREVIQVEVDAIRKRLSAD
ncbi:hypothetical protein K2X40_01675 [Candidatus Babeliales bacterium]|nr:hypothetical protein [Candidatus Babeliales bacterium]